MPLALSSYNAPILHTDLLQPLQAETIFSPWKRREGESRSDDQSLTDFEKIAALRRQEPLFGWHHNLASAEAL